jgi:hypothetical protein
MTNDDKLIWILGSAVVFMAIGVLTLWWNRRGHLKRMKLSEDERFSIDPFHKVPWYVWGSFIIFFSFYLVYYGFNQYG